MIPENFLIGSLGALLFGLVGLVLFIGGYFAFDKLTPKINVSEELSKGNIAVGIVIAFLLLSIAIVVSSVLR